MSKKVRVAGYCRTSGESQRDNTSIPRQREAIARTCDQNDGWELVETYVDEAKSGSKVEGRDDFQRMMRDAANGKFDAIVVFDVTRFARDGVDVLTNAKTLKSTFGIFLVDSKGQFDNRSAKNVLQNHIFAGVSEQERLSIMERMIGGRIAKAKAGVPWSGSRPYGRDFDKKIGTWFITDVGERTRELLKRYAEGEFLNDLCKEFGFSAPQVILRAVRDGQLTGTFTARFNSPEIDIVDFEVPVPVVPEVITERLLKKVRKRMEHNRSNNKEGLRRYLFSGYVFCGRCGCALSSTQTDGVKYYRHRLKSGTEDCGFHSIREDVIERDVLGYLYRFFLDEPAFEAAVKAAMPSDDDRGELVKLADRLESEIAKHRKQLDRLVDAILNGADPAVLVSRQDRIKADIESAQLRLDDAKSELASMPEVELAAKQREALRLHLMVQHRDKDWTRIPFDDRRKFLRSMFGDNCKKTGNGIRIEPHGEDWRMTLVGSMGLDRELIRGQAKVPGMDAEKARYRKEIERILDETDSDHLESPTNWFTARGCSI